MFVRLGYRQSVTSKELGTSLSGRNRRPVVTSRSRASVPPKIVTFYLQIPMKTQLLVSAAILGVLGCQTDKALEPAPTYHLTATVTQSNTCDVSVQDKNYSSIGQVRGDVPKAFVGTITQGYHGFGCWVATSGGDGDLIVLFSGNNLGKPLDPGTYQIRREILDDTPLGFANVTFRPSDLNGDKLVTADGAQGTVVVTATPDGGRTITVDVQVSRWARSFI